MEDKGYPHPLYSLDLIGPAGAPPEGPRHAIHVPQGRLVVRPALRREGHGVSTSACEAALRAALAYHRLAREGFARYGMSGPWVDNLRHWGERLRALDAERAAAVVRGGRAAVRRQGLLFRGRKIWGQLALSEKLGALEVRPLRVLPRRLADLTRALEEAARRADARERREALARSGFSPAHQAELCEVAAGLRAVLDEERDHAGEARRKGDALSVLRGAILGDLARLCQAAPEVLPRGVAEGLTMRRLLGRDRRPATGPGDRPR